MSKTLGELLPLQPPLPIRVTKEYIQGFITAIREGYKVRVVWGEDSENFYMAVENPDYDTSLTHGFHKDPWLVIEAVRQ